MKRRWISKLLKWLGILVLVFIAYITYTTWLKPVRLEQLRLESLNGNAIALDSLLSNKHTVLNFWATWCKPCIEEMPMLDSVYRSLDKERWQIFLVSDESVEKIREFQARQYLSMPFLKLDGKLSEIGISVLPKTIVMDENRKVLLTRTGGLTMGAREFIELLDKYE